MTNYVIINGVNSNTINGLGINELPPITKPQMRVQNEEIDGRDGDITTNLGYSAYDKTITIGLFGTGYDINDIVAFFNGEGTIVFSNEADKYYNFKIINQIDYVALQKFKSATITFHCQPFKYPLTETPLEIEYSYIEDEGENLTLNDTAESTLELTLKGNTSQNTTTGKNKIGLSDGAYADHNVTATVSNGVITLSGTATGEASVVDIPLLDIISSSLGTVTKSLNPTGTYTGVQTSLRASNSDSVGLWSNNGTNNTGSLSGNAYKFRIQVNVGVSVNCTLKPQIELGSTATSWEIFTYGASPNPSYPQDVNVVSGDNEVVVCGKNLFDKDSTTTQVGYFTSTGAIQSGGSSTITTSYTRITPNTQMYLSGGTNVIENVCYYDKNKNFIERVISNVKSINKDAYYIRFQITTSSLNLDTLQLELGNEATPYEPYQSQTYEVDLGDIELCKIGTYQDYFTKNSDGEWCKYNAIGKLVLDENSGMETAGTSTFRIPSDLVSNLLFPATNTNLLQAYVNYLQIVTWSSEWSDYTSFISAPRNPNDRIRIRVENQTTLTDLNNWLSTHNIIIYYVLNTPYLSLIEDNNLIEQLDNLQNAMSYSGTTNINQVNDDKAFIISTKALEQGSNEVVVNNIGNAYSKPLIALEGSGNVDIYLGNTQILKANVEDKMNIDIAKLEAYNPDTSVLLNRQVIGNYNSMTLQPGNNTIRIDGALDKATISNYTRWL